MLSQLWFPSNSQEWGVPLLVFVVGCQQADTVNLFLRVPVPKVSLQPRTRTYPCPELCYTSKDWFSLCCTGLDGCAELSAARAPLLPSFSAFALGSTLFFPSRSLWHPASAASLRRWSAHAFGSWAKGLRLRCGFCGRVSLASSAFAWAQRQTRDAKGHLLLERAGRVGSGSVHCDHEGIRKVNGQLSPVDLHLQETKQFILFLLFILSFHFCLMVKVWPRFNQWTDIFLAEIFFN